MHSSTRGRAVGSQVISYQLVWHKAHFSYARAREAVPIFRMTFPSQTAVEYVERRQERQQRHTGLRQESRKE
jgi:hypothetical protein